MPQLVDYNKHDDGKLVNLLVPDLTELHMSDFYKMNMDNIYILNQQLFSIFPNLHYIEISAPLRSGLNGQQKDPWTKRIWDSSSGRIKEAYAKKGFTVTIDRYGSLLVIKRNKGY